MIPLPHFDKRLGDALIPFMSARFLATTRMGCANLAQRRRVDRDDPAVSNGRGAPKAQKQRPIWARPQPGQTWQFLSGINQRRRNRHGMHGGAPGSGAPRGNKNAMKHGLYTRKAMEERRLTRPGRTICGITKPYRGQHD
jgi:hypothetical protein